MRPEDDFSSKVRSTSPLLLQKLPFLTIKEVLKFLNTETLFDLSCCSRKTQKIVRSFSEKNRKISIILACDNAITISLKGSDYFKIIFLKPKPIFEHKKQPIGLYSDRIRPNRMVQLTEFQDIVDMMIVFISHFLNSFDLEIEEIRIESDCINDQFLKFIRSIISKKPKIEYFSFDGKVENDDFKYFIQNSTVTQNFILRCSTVIPFDFNFHLNLKELILDGDWCTVGNLLSMEFETCELLTSQFTMEHWKTLLEAWRNGWNPKMKYLAIQRTFKFQSIVNFLPFGSLRDNSIVRRIKYDFLRGGLDIQRISDGFVATVYPRQIFRIIDHGRTYDSIELHVCE